MKLSSILDLGAAPNAFKLHLACWNGSDHPLDVFVRDEQEWDGWNAYRGHRDDFSRPRILSFMEFYHEPETWLFGGIYDVIARGAPWYTIQRHAASEPFIGRLKVRLKRPGRAKAFLLERYLEKIEVTELLRERYTGRAFPGYEWISHPFHELEAVIRHDRPDWRAALENVKGVYLVLERRTHRPDRRARVRLRAPALPVRAAGASLHARRRPRDHRARSLLEDGAAKPGAVRLQPELTAPRLFARASRRQCPTACPDRVGDHAQPNRVVIGRQSLSYGVPIGRTGSW